jgi:O-antigen/teichoic acid export membrane protein
VIAAEATNIPMTTASDWKRSLSATTIRNAPELYAIVERSVLRSTNWAPSLKHVRRQATTTKIALLSMKLSEYPTGLVQGLAQIFTPMPSQFDASGDLAMLRQVFIAENRACALVIFLVCAVLVILGKPIIEVWVGTKYLPSYSILILLVIPKTLYLAQAASTKVLLGMGRHRLLALVFLLEGGVKVGLSVLLLRYFGMLESRWARLFRWFVLACSFCRGMSARYWTVPLGAYVRQAFLVLLALSGPLGVVLVLSRSVFPARSYSQLLMEAGPGVVTYGLGLLWFFFLRESAGVKWSTALAAIPQPALPR